MLEVFSIRVTTVMPFLFAKYFEKLIKELRKNWILLFIVVIVQNSLSTVSETVAA